MTLREIIIALGFNVDQQSVTNAENTVKKVKSMATKLLGAIGIGFSIAGISNLAETAAEAEALKSQFSQVFGDMESDAESKLKKISDDTGVFENRMKASFTQIAAFAKTTGMDQAESLNIADRAMQAVADSSAFYDRSIEQVTETMQSFLKGNYANDAALGLSCTETTRNAAANALYAKSFNDLSEAEKQLTLLKMVEDANKTSGALGQAARESDTWGNQLGNLKQSLVDLKAAAGAGFLKPAVNVLKILITLAKSVTVKIQDLTKEGGILDRVFESIHATVKRLQPAMERMTQAFNRGLQKTTGFVKSVVDRLGGIENVLRLLSVVAGAFIIAMNWSKITGLAKGFLNVVQNIGKVFNATSIKVAAIIAVIVVIALIVEDFVNFLMGNDSVIGTFFDKAGIGADNARKAIFSAWNKIKEFLLGVWNVISTMAKMFADTVGGFFSKHAESIKGIFERAWGIIKTFLSGVWTFISQIATAIFGGTEETISGTTQSTSDKILTIWQAILDALTAVWDFLYSIASTLFNALATVIEAVFSGIQEFWNAWGEQIISWFQMIWDTAGTILMAFLDVVQGIADFISSVFTGDWAGAWQAIQDIFTGVWNAISAFTSAIWNTISGIVTAGFNAVSDAVSSIAEGIKNKVVAVKDSLVDGITSAVDWVKGLASDALTWGSDIVGNIADGIKNGISKVTDAVKGVGEKIKSFLHFSVPDEGPLTEFESWMPDFMQGLGNGIDSSKDSLLDKVKGVAENMSAIIQSGTAKATTAATSTINNTNSSINQTVNIANSYNGGTADTQRNISKAMKKSAVDATTQMARGIAIARI